MLSPELKSIHDAVFVVTIDSHAERHANVISELGKGNFEFVYGIDKRDTSLEELIDRGIYDEDLARKLDPKDRPMNLAQVCCAHTHLQIYEMMLEKDMDRVLIFEDDLKTGHFTESEISAALENLPEDAEVVLWGWLGGRFRPPLGAFQQAIFHVKHALGAYKFNHTMIRNLYMRPYNGHFHAASVNFGTYAYSVTRTAAEKMLSLNRPIAFPSDHVTIYGALREDFRMYVSARQFFGNRSFDPDDPMPSQVPGYY